ncbi:MAG: tetratricopeptide repeat protein, partial [Deltaproteobacteria bacterium]|nr:tetratricopeptide repeat protein [Deltaproteobacteria bacterium]
MTPNFTVKNGQAAKNWDSGDSEPAVDSNCHGSCHSDPAKGSDPFLISTPKPTWFLDAKKKSNPLLSPQGVNDLKSWLVEGSPPSKTSTIPVIQAEVPAPLTPPKPSNAKDAAAYGDQAKELERQGRLSLEPEKKLAFFQSALAFRLLAGDAKACGALLDQIDSQYQKPKDETGQKFVAATRLWVEGKTAEAFKSLADLEKPAGERGYAFYHQYSLQRALMLQSTAAEKLRQNDFEGARALLLDALRVQPSDQLAGKMLKLFAEHQLADLAGQDANLKFLRAQRDQLMTPPAKCNTGHHSSSAPTIDFSGGDFLDKKAGIDLSKYRKLTFLNYQQKVRLYRLDQDIATATDNDAASLASVRKILALATAEEPGDKVTVIEGKFLTENSAFADADASLAWELAGEAYLGKKEYTKAAAALDLAVQENPSNIDAQYALGKARFATGEFKASRGAYAAILRRQPDDVSALRLRADADAHRLAALDPKTDSTEISQLQQELGSDRAMLLARCNQGEKEKIQELGKQLARLHEDGEVDLESRQGSLAMGELLANQYFSLAKTPQAGPKETELVRKEMNGLAAETFGQLATFAKADSDPGIKKRGELYEGYRQLALGDYDAAAKIFEPIRKEVPEADKILSELETQKLRLVNLSALEAWERYNTEGERVQGDAQSGLLGSVLGGLESWGRKDGKDFRDDTKAKWARERAFVAELKSKIQSGKANSILDAMKQIQAEGPESMKANATSYINYEDRAVTGYPLGALVHLVDKLPPEPGEAEELLHKTWDLERQNPAFEAPYALYSIVNAIDPKANYNGFAREHMDALEGNGSFGRSAFKFITSMSPESLAVDVGLMVASAGLGNLAKLSMMAKLEKAGVTGYKALAIARGTGFAVEATSLWAGNLGKEAMLQDPSKVFSQDHLLKSYGATLVMIGGLKVFGAVGEELAPRIAKSLGLVTEGGTKLTVGGKALSWGIGHGMGLGGMIATSHINQAAGFAPKPVGGWKEGLVHDVFGYAQFAVAHKIADRAFGGKLSTVSQKQQNEIAFREAVSMAKSQADIMGFRATRNIKGEIIDSPERQILVGLLVDASLNKTGFSGGKLGKFVATRKFAEANAYMKEFGLPLEYSKDGRLNAVLPGEVSPHEAAGIPAGKAKAEKSPVSAEVDLYLKNLGAQVGHWMDKAAEWLFGPPGGGFGGMEPAFAGATGMVGAKPEPKGPPTVFMSNKGEGSGKGKSKGKAAEPALSPIAAKAIQDHPLFEVIPYTVKPGENFDAALSSLSNHFQDATKIIVIEASRPIENPETILDRIGHYDPRARVEIHMPDGSVKVAEGKL